MEGLRRARLRKGLSQEQLSENTLLAQSYISDLERGARVNPSRKVLEALAKALDCTVDDLLKGAEKTA